MSRVQIFVNSVTGNDTTGDGSLGAPFKTLSKAAAYNPGGGNVATVNVADNGWTAPYTALNAGDATIFTTSYAGTAWTTDNYWEWKFNGAIITRGIDVTGAWTRLPGFAHVYYTSFSPVSAPYGYLVRGGGAWFDTAQKIPLRVSSLTRKPMDSEWYNIFYDSTNSVLFLCSPGGNPASTGVTVSYWLDGKHGIRIDTSKGYHHLMDGLFFGGSYQGLFYAPTKAERCLWAYCYDGWNFLNTGSGSATVKSQIQYCVYLDTTNLYGVRCTSDYGSNIYNCLFIGGQTALYYVSASAIQAGYLYRVRNCAFVGQSQSAFGYNTNTVKGAFDADYNFYGGNTAFAYDEVMRAVAGAAVQSSEEAYTFGAHELYDLPTVEYLMIGDADGNIDTDLSNSVGRGSPVNLGADGSLYVYIGRDRIFSRLYFNLSQVGIGYSPTWEYSSFNADSSAITGLTSANPCRLTWASHGLETGDKIYFTEISTAPWSALRNIEFTVTKVDGNYVTLDGINTTGWDAYSYGTNGGGVYKSVTQNRWVSLTTATSYNAGAAVIPNVGGVAILSVPASGWLRVQVGDHFGYFVRFKIASAWGDISQVAKANDIVGAKSNLDAKLVGLYDGNFRPQRHSPLMNHGVTIAGLTTDLNGNSVPLGPAPEIGVCEIAYSSPRWHFGMEMEL